MISQLDSKRLFMVRHHYYPSANEKPRFLPLTIYKIRAGFKTDMSEGRNFSEMVETGARLHGVGRGLEVSSGTSHWNVTQ